MNLLHDYNVIDEDTIKKVFEISESANEEVFVIEESKLKYGIVSNFYKDPVCVKEFFKQFPVISSSVSNSPGVQVYFSQNFNNSLSHIFEYFHNIIIKHQYPHNIRNLYNVPIWETYLNMYWKKMNATKANMIPHVDNFSYGFNIWLTEDIPAGTDFYSYKWENYREVYTLNEFRDVDAGRYPMFMNAMCNLFTNEEEQHQIDWDPKKLDETVWRKYHTIEPKYNTVSYYPGCFFHMPSVSPELYDDNFLRLSQVVTYSFTDAQSFHNYYQNYKNHPEFSNV